MPEGNYWTHRISRRTALRGAGIGVAGLAGAALIGCGDDGDDAPAAQTEVQQRATAVVAAGVQAKPGGTFSFNTGSGNVPHLDLRQYTFHVTSDLSLLMHKRLMRPSKASHEPELDIAASLEQPDPTTFIFKLIPGVKFQNRAPVNGRELTAEDVVASLKAVAGPGATYLYANELSKVDRIEAVDKSTVKLVMKQPDVTTLTSLMLPPMIILPKEVLETFKNDIKSPEANIGLGPFMVEKWNPDTGGTFVPNPNYYLKGKPYIQKVQHFVIPDAAVAWARFLSGELTKGSVNAKDLDSIANDKKYFLSENTPYFSAVVAIPNQTRAPFTDPRSIKALHLLNARYEFPDLAYKGRGKLAIGLGTMHRSWMLSQDAIQKLPGHRPQGSKERDEDIKNGMALLSAMGFSKSKPMTFEPLMATLSSGYGAGRLLGEYWAAMWERESGGAVKPTVKLVDYAATKEREIQGQFDMTGSLYTTGPDPDNVFTTLYHSTGGRNYGKHKDPVLDDMIVKQRAIFKSEERHAAVNKIQEHLATADNPGPISFGAFPSVYAWPSTLKDFNGDAMAHWQLEHAWFDA